MDPIHELEQLSAGLADIAILLFQYKQDLVKQKFTEQQAFQLVRDYQMILLNNKN
ncbi:hypothetical protein MKZ20_17620 [Psychrobacillus sp. FSL K6-2684]|uniref:hypothetical protein n=1 Tax=Psychrobacillus sp. FSL K6-2684 TaxID=2921547 RepID=UPI0030F8117D